MAATRGREVASGTLWMTKNEQVKVRVRVVACCGTPDCTHQGQTVLYEESNTLGGSAGVVDKPSRVLFFSTIAEVTSLNGNQPSTVGPSVTGLSLDGQTSLANSSLWGLMLLLTSGEAVELFADTREQQQQWVQYLNLLSMFPYSPIPEEPRSNPIRNSLRTKLKLSNFDADSVWLVYVLAEEVGSRVQALGVHYITLRSSLVKGSPALLSIISPLDSEPIVTWEANKMRRTGSLGNMVFIEIGRRCEGGPGLIWMHSCPEDLNNFRETLKRFLFNGDGRPISSNTSSIGTGIPSSKAHQQLGSMYSQETQQSDCHSPRLSIASSGSSSPSSSGGSSFKLSFNNSAPKVIKQSAEYDLADQPDIYETPDVMEYDYAFHTGSTKGPNRTSTLLSSTPPPPINLTSHPSRKKELAHKRSSSIPNAKNIINTSVEVTMATGNGAGLAGQQRYLKGSTDSGLASTISLEDDFQSIDESLSLIMSELNSTSDNNGDVADDKDNLDDLINQLETFATSSPTDDTNSSVKRSNTLPSGQTRPAFKRAHSTSTCHPMHYMKLRNPKAELMKDGYVVMGSGGRAMLDKVPEERNSTITTPKNSRRRRRTSYDQLELRQEDNEQGQLELRQEDNEQGQTQSSNESEYVNHPLPPEVANATPVLYQRKYENVLPHNGTGEDEPIDEAIYMNHDQGPMTDKEMKRLFSSTWDEIDNLQQVLNQFGVSEGQ